MLSHLAEPITVEQMAARAGMSRRSFHSHFRAATGATPLVWLHQQRVGRTKELLEATDCPLRTSALGTPANLRVHFRRSTSIAPSRHRRLFATGARDPA